MTPLKMGFELSKQINRTRLVFFKGSYKFAYFLWSASTQ